MQTYLQTILFLLAYHMLYVVVINSIIDLYKYIFLFVLLVKQVI